MVMAAVMGGAITAVGATIMAGAEAVATTMVGGTIIIGSLICRSEETAAVGGVFHSGSGVSLLGPPLSYWPVSTP
jgi:hypothetical protein